MKPMWGKDQVTLDQAVAAVRDDEPAPGQMEEAAARVRARLQAEAKAPAGPVPAIRGCADVEALLPAHRAGTLPGPRALLVEDHLHECAPCRARLRDPEARPLSVLAWRPATSAPRPARRSWGGYAAAASVLLALAVGGEAARRAFFAVPPGSRATVQSLSGVLQRVDRERTSVLAPGETLGEDEGVRTAGGAQAVLELSDGSLVEMGERAELSVTARGRDTTIHLERGQVIVQAAKRRTGRLLVASKDCTVQVTGTVFTVNRGLKGSRVSVLEGHVRVVQSGRERHLQPGEQLTTSEAIGAVPLRDEIAWSRDFDHHLALLAEVQALREKWQALPTPGLRYESRLLGRLPAGTVVFAAVPNYGEALGEAHRLFQERLQESPVLREWWQEADPARHGGPSLDDVIERVRTLSEYLGDEVVLAVVLDARGEPAPLLLAEVRRPGLQEVLDREMADLPRDARTRVHVLLRSDVVALSGQADALRALSGAAGPGLAATPFGQRVGECYRNGAGMLFAADLEQIVSRSLARQKPSRETATLRRAGFDGLRHLIFEHKDVAGHPRSQALMTFAGPRRGLASWLAAPAPMGALDFLSPNAQGVVAFIAKSPALVLDDVLAIAQTGNPRAGEDVRTLESRLDLRLREDVAMTLGGEFALAFDGPLLPTPSWKAVVEVNDPARLQASLQVLVDRGNEEVARRGRPGLRLEAEQSGGQTYYALRGEGLPVEVHYTFSDGYLVAGPSRALVAQALHTRSSGDTLGRSGRFRALLPPDGHSNVSALAYQNLGGALGALAEAGRRGPLTPEQQGSLEALAQGVKPRLLCAYGLPDGIQLASLGGLLDLNPSELALPMLLENVVPGTTRRQAP